MENVPTFDEAPGTEDDGPVSMRFIDYDADKKIDIIRATGTSTTVYRNAGSEYVVDDSVGLIEAGFVEDGLDFADMNGDGLQDPVVKLADGTVRYRLNLGWGQWGPWVELMLLDSLDENDKKFTEFEDINGDSLSDIVIVTGDVVRYALNRNADRFDDFRAITSADVNGAIPNRDATTTVLYADMNGNGTDDVTWITSDGDVTYLEIFPLRPNLMTRMENGLGWVQKVSYGTSVLHLANDREDGVDWEYKLPNSMMVVDRLDNYVTLTGNDDGTGLHEVREFHYRDGYYDGIEKQFRGFANVVEHSVGDTTRDDGFKTSRFDVGATDPYFNGLLLAQSLTGGPAGSPPEPIWEDQFTHVDCTVSGIDQVDPNFPVRNICQTVESRLVQEGAPEAEWLRTRTTKEFDGYGNVTLEFKEGVVGSGPTGSAGCAACTGVAGEHGEPCGATCLGDELYTETEYVQPDDNNGAWFLRLPVAVRTYADASSALYTEELTYYDGESFVGLAQGLIDGRGVATRVTAKVASDSPDVVHKERNAYDTDGNLVDKIDALGDIADTTSHRRTWKFDPSGMHIIQTDIANAPTGGSPYVLRREYGWDPALQKLTESTAWMLVEGGEVKTGRNSTRFRYDEFGRMSKRILPGDSESSPSEEYTFELGDPVSRISTRKRSIAGGPLDLIGVGCVDGRGREFQRRLQVADGEVQVVGFKVLNAQGELVKDYQPYAATTLDCEQSEPSEVRFVATRYDAAGRSVRVTQPDADLYGTASIARTVYRPLVQTMFDPEDNDPTSAHHNTPTVRYMDGLERLVAIDRYLDDYVSGTPATIAIRYDGLGRLVRYTDPAGHTTTQSHDLLERVVEAINPNSGTTTFTYDAAGNKLQEVDARNITTAWAYDGLNRPVSKWNAAGLK